MSLFRSNTGGLSINTGAANSALVPIPRNPFFLFSSLLFYPKHKKEEEKETKTFVVLELQS